ncbi:DUF3152 domain-containing protein [Actinacidiphila bryophytorum]|uniref:DUF3152 domain-containing protein n=1 Tax=Actinacidiphila bryophytorum TaxID=1436133 RepID=A0A9W4H456_9ACTN|nr:DUF3152 domain-containing protein [Actinacidiphila bryophytorum]MBM9435987.1 DUF3152 domain-containing protein [Actinacidiphila bryophytorum]MBN6541450.1 DUF3152 domain-containing protein [Actinacidiphila bryophytorum]CAG7649240.1 conserved exported hypothetical protein [Actinacidiphila bryophytorum]
MAAQRSGRRHGRRRAKKRAAIAGPLALGVILLVVATAGYAAWHKTQQAGGSAALDDGVRATATTAPPSAGEVDSSRSPSATPSASHTAATTPPSPSRTPSAPPPMSVPKSGTGTFSIAKADGSASGHGLIRRYKVEVEGGISLSATDAAHEIAAILANPRGWTADGHDGFQLVSSGRADFVIKIATPDTVDDICGAAGLLTRGEVNCDVGATVVVNLKRWMLGSPEFDGPIEGYRALIINHEVGHRIGHHHEGCPGPGRPAPVMMQQIKGLKGCTANQWPYDSHGRYISGPPVA